MKRLIKDLMRKSGIGFKDLIIPYYLIPYNFFNGKALHPLSVTIELTYLCNLKCKMCPLENAKNNGKQVSIEKNTELTTEEIRKLIDELKKTGVKSILLTGGEPFLRKDINEIISYIKNKDFHLSILSNGYFITSKHAKAMVESGLGLISFSVDGPEKIHNEIRGLNNSFENICRSIKLIEDEKKRLNKSLPKIILNCTVSALNHDYISEIVEIAHTLNVRLVDYMYLFYTDQNKIEATQKVMEVGKLKPESQIMPDNIKYPISDKLIQQINLAKKKAKEYKVAVGFNPPLKDSEIEKRFFDPNFSFSSKCFYPWYETRIDPYGNIYPCSLDVRMGNIRETVFDEIWNGEKYINFRKKLKETKLFPMCTKCCKLVNRYWSFLPAIKI